MQHGSRNLRRPRLGYGLMDALVIAACGLTFVAVVNATRQGDGKGPPIAQIARDLGTTPDGLRLR